MCYSIGRLGSGAMAYLTPPTVALSWGCGRLLSGHSASSLAVYERGHLSGPEILRFDLWMTLVAYLVVLVVALRCWAAVGEPPVMRSGE